MSDVATVVREVLAGAADEEAGWAQLSELGLTTVGVPEERGGSGGDLADLAEVVGAVAESGWDLPVAAHAVAAWAGGVLPVRGAVVLSGAGAPPPRVTGPVSHVVVAPLDGGPARLVVLDDGATVGAAGVEQEIGLAGAVPCAVPGTEVAARLAVLRAAAITGAARAAYRLTREHVAVREQFGRPLVRIPAVATALARARVELVQAEVATDRAVGATTFTAAVVARVVCGAAATRIAAAAHQLHGAIGVTQECGLHPLTRLLWVLRDADLPEEAWAELLGSDAVDVGELYLWDELTVPTG